jgi:hypothetical protein
MRKLPNGCEMVFSDKKRMVNGKMTKCNKKELKYYCYTNGLFYCNKCAHEMGQRNSALDFVKISSLTKSKLPSNE